MIACGIQSRANEEITDALVLEAMAHTQFAQQKCIVFHGRKGFVDKMKELVQDRERKK